MRINVVIGAFLPIPPRPSGAIEKVWVQLATRFSNLGHDVTIISRQWEGDPGREEIDGITHIRASGFARTGSKVRDLIRDLKYSRVIRRHLPPADVTVSNCFWLAALLRSAPEVGLLDHHLQRFPKRQMWLYKHVDRISTVSDAIADAVRAQTPSVAGLLDVIGNPVDTSIFHPLETPPSRNPKRVIFHGRVHPEKGLTHLVEAIRVCATRGTDLELSVIGPYEVAAGGGGRRYLDRLQRIADGLPVGFKGAVNDQEQLASELQKCDIHCYPSLAFHGEASPVAPLEAMACGAALVVSDLPQFAGYVHDGTTGVVFEREGGDVTTRIADALMRIANDDAFRHQLREAGIAEARKFTIDSIADRHLAAWQALLDRKG